MKSKYIGVISIFLGLLLFAAAFWITTDNFRQEQQAAYYSGNALDVLKEEIILREEASETVIPEYLQDPAREMSVVEVDEDEYVGVLEISALGLQLPVISDWSYPKLKRSPCRYQGSPYQNNLIIMAHNYKSHFGNLLKLTAGDQIYFTDAAGDVFAYTVVQTEMLEGTDVEEMSAGDWDLTLFTCTVGGKSRVTVRCERND